MTAALLVASAKGAAAVVAARSRREPAAIGGDLDHRLLREVHHLAGGVDAPAVEGVRLAREPAHRLREEVLPQRIHTEHRRHLVAAQHTEQKLLIRRNDFMRTAQK